MTNTTGTGPAGTITMYGAQWCGDCRRAKKFFDDNEIAFTYVNLEETPDAVDIVLARNYGVQKIPVIVFPDDSHLTEPTNEQLAAKMADFSPEAAAEVATEPTVIRNDEAGRYELRRDGDLLSFATFTQRDDAVLIPHVETIPEHRGNNHAARLMDGTLDLIRSANQTVTPLCPFAAAHVQNNPAHHDLLTSR